MNFKKEENLDHQNRTSEEPRNCTSHHANDHKLPSKNTQFSRNPLQKTQQNREKSPPATQKKYSANSINPKE
jgi:hypothetical protein